MSIATRWYGATGLSEWTRAEQVDGAGRHIRPAATAGTEGLSRPAAPESCHASDARPALISSRAKAVVRCRLFNREPIRSSARTAITRRRSNPATGVIREYDFREALSELAHAPTAEERKATRCESCAAEFDFDSHIHSGECPFCGTPIVEGTGAERHIKPESLLPFEIDEEHALQQLQEMARQDSGSHPTH